MTNIKPNSSFTAPIPRAFYPMPKVPLVIGDTPRSSANYSLPVAPASFSPRYAAPHQQNENDVLSKLSARERWRYLSSHRPVEAVISVATIIIAAYVLVHELRAGAMLMSFLIGSAVAADGDARMSAIDGSLVLTGILTVCLLWSYGLISFASAPKKIEFARESIKFLQGFITGLFVTKSTH